jgi:hypothetical protein
MAWRCIAAQPCAQHLKLFSLKTSTLRLKGCSTS